MARGRIFVLGLLGLLMGAPPASAQEPATGTVVGRLTGAETQSPLVGATVVIASRGALTDEQGRFTITRVPIGTHTLTVSLIGYAPATQEVTVAAGQTVRADVVMGTQALRLAELVVTGYGTQKAGNISGAVTQLKAEEFNTGRIISAEQLIQSKVAGVQIVDNNEPGGGMTIRIRGATSVNAASDPLFVLDGVAIGSSGGGLSAGRNPLNFLNPEDIASITVLKDAATAAIYGANAANGVVLIETKSGSRQMGFEYSGSVSGSTITRRPSMMNADQFRAAVQQYAPQNATQLANESTDWYDLVDRNAFGQEHNVAISNSGPTSSYRFSLGFLNQDGVISGTTTERLSGLVNFEQKLFDDRLTVRSSLKGARTHDLFTPGGVLSNAAQMGPTQPVRDEQAPTGYYDWPGNQLTSADNPIAILDLARDEGTTWRFVGNLQGGYQVPFLEGLRANLNLAFDMAKATRSTFTPSVLHSQLKTGNGGNDYRRDDTQQNTGIDAYLSYAAPIGPTAGTLDLTAGYAYAEQHGDYPWYSADGLSTDLLNGNGRPTAELVSNGLWIDESRLISFFGRANYSLKDRYLLAASLRRDGSSRFGPDNAWATFPAVSLGWRISEEPFMSGLTAITDLKLRGSWGRTGNQAFANYQQYTTYMVGDARSQVQFGDQFVNTMRPGAADPNIKWEGTDSYNLGLDFGIIGGRLNGSIDAYQKNTDDLIFTVPIAAGTNLSNYMTTNIGAMENRGLEFTLNARVREGGSDGLSWTANFNAGYNQNELVRINPLGGENQQVLTGLVAGGVGTYIQVLQPGQPINSFFVYQHRLVDGKPIYEDRTGLNSQGTFTGTPDGTINEQDLYEDLNGDNRINVDDRRAYYNPAPDWILGQSSFFTYGSLDLSYTLRAYLGNRVYNNVASNLGTYAEVGRGSPYNLHTSVLETGFLTPQYLSDYYVEDGSFLRMDNITLGYGFDWRGRPMRFFGAVQNAFTLTGYDGVDPTAGLNGLDNNIYPRSRTFTAGVNVRF